MKNALVLIMCLTFLSGCSSAETATPIQPWYPAINEKGDPVFAVFESRIPCIDCEKIKFALVLYRNRESKKPTTYKMARVHVAKGNDRTINEGAWTIAHGTTLDPRALVYQLDANAPPAFRNFWAIGDDILFILDQNMNPRAGTAGYGYALNRTR